MIAMLPHPMRATNLNAEVVMVLGYLLAPNPEDDDFWLVITASGKTDYERMGNLTFILGEGWAEA